MKNKLVILFFILTLIQPYTCYADGQHGLELFVFALFIISLLLVIALFIAVYVVTAGIYNRTRFNLSLLITFVLIILIVLIFQEKPFDMIADLAVLF